MRVTILSSFLLISSSLLLSTVVCDPNHHHINHNDFPWQNILSSLGIVVENQTSEATATNKEHYTSESTVEILKSETNDDYEIPVVVQNGTSIDVGSSTDSSENSGVGLKVGIPVSTILFFIGLWWCIRKFCCNRKTTAGAIVMQSNIVQTQQPAPAAPQIIIQQPIIQQHAPPPQGPPQWSQPPPQGPSQWSQPPPQGPPQWNQSPQGPPQWAPHQMGQQQHYSPNSGYDNAGFNQPPPPPYNTGKY